MDISAIISLLPAIFELLKTHGPLALVVFGSMVGLSKLQIPAVWKPVMPLALGVVLEAVWQFTHGTPLNGTTIAEVVKMGLGGGVTSTSTYSIIKHIAEKYPVVGTWILPAIK